MTDETKPTYEDLLKKVEERFSSIKNKWHANGKLAWSIYLGDELGTPFNILYSNTEIIVPAVFSKRPVARVTRRFDEERADIPAQVCQRMLTFLMDKNMASYPSFFNAIEDSVLDAALPGQGLVRVRLVRGMPCTDYVRWDRFAWQKCARWEDCNWIAFALDMEAKEVLAQFKDLTPDQKSYFEQKAREITAEEGDTSPDEDTDPKALRVWEVWDRKERKVRFLCAAAQDALLEEQDDPFKLEGFYPCANPLTLIHNTTDTLPRPLYKVYQEQAEELNEITRRLRKIIRAVKVRGIYATGMEDIEKVFKEDDDAVLIPSTAASSVVMTGKGVDAYIWLMPIEDLMKTATALFDARERVKQTIYEILGIGDILRGVTKASETLGAQELKDKWGSLRVNKARERVAGFIRDTLRVILELAINKMPPELWGKVTGLQLMDPKEAMQIQATGGQVPSIATWPGLVQSLQDDLSRAYLIDIETNSTVDSEVSGEKQDAAEFVSGFGQTIAGVKDIMMTGAEGWAVGLKILGEVCAKFQIGQDILVKLSKIPAPNPQANPEVQKAMGEAQKALQQAQKMGENVAKEDQILKETRAELDSLLKDLAHEQEALQQRRDQLRRDGDGIQKEIELALREAEIKIKEGQMDIKMAEQSLNMAGEKAKMSGEKAVHASRMEAQKTQMTGQAVGHELDKKASEVDMATERAGMSLEKQAHSNEMSHAQKDLKLQGREQSLSLKQKAAKKPKGK
jgi:hypothetical protein